MSRVAISSGDFEFVAEFELAAAPKTSEWFSRQLPFHSQVIHARWSGEAVWVPLGELESGLQLENNTAYPSKGEILFYPAAISETEILFPYGSAAFASKAGTLSGNHFLTVISGKERLAEFGKHVLWGGAMDIVFEATD